MPTPSEIPTGKRRWPWWGWLLVAAGVGAAALLLLRRDAGGGTEIATFAARRGPLDITVLEGGSVQALESQEIKCEVRIGYQGIKILKIVDEGYEVTDEDIRTNKVLVELDSSDLQKQIVQQDIQYESAAASLTDAQQNYEIQLNQNLSDIKAAEQKARFARMDFDKLLGDQVTQKIIDQLGLEKALALEESTADQGLAAVVASSLDKPAADDPSGLATNSPAMPAPLRLTNGAAAGPAPAGPTVATAPQPPAPAKTPAAQETVVPEELVDFSQYAHVEVLGDGEAKQKLRKFEDDLQVAKKEEGQSRANLDGTRRLFDKGFVMKVDLERDELAAENSRLKVQTAETARDLYLKYEFGKTAEEALSKYSEAVRELVRARKAAVSKLAQARAKLKSAQGQYNIQARQRKELYEQQDKCIITAKKPGLVVYGGARDDMFYYGGEERIREGATVRERQSIITIPDMSKMSVRVKIHESYIKKVKKGQKARVTVDAYPDKVLEGEVTNVGVLPDSQNRWMNPDMKVYLTTITINGAQDWIKPGMSAKVEIIVNRLADAVFVPVQAVSPFEGKQVCYLGTGAKPERRMVEVGDFNDEFIEIKSGLKEGEKVRLHTETAPAEKPTQKSPPATPPRTPANPAAAAPAVSS